DLKITYVIKDELSNECHSKLCNLFKFLCSCGSITPIDDCFTIYGLLCKYLLFSVYLFHYLSNMLAICNIIGNVNFVYNIKGFSFAVKLDSYNAFVSVRCFMANHLIG